MSKDKDLNNSIKCDVNTCKHHCDDCCTLDSVKICCTCNSDDCTCKKETICDSFQEK